MSYTMVLWCLYSAGHGLIGLVVKASALREADPELDSRLRRERFFRVESYR